MPSQSSTRSPNQPIATSINTPQFGDIGISAVIAALYVNKTGERQAAERKNTPALPGLLQELAA